MLGRGEIDTALSCSLAVVLACPGSIQTIPGQYPENIPSLDKIPNFEQIPSQKVSGVGIGIVWHAESI